MIDFLSNENRKIVMDFHSMLNEFDESRKIIEKDLQKLINESKTIKIPTTIYIKTRTKTIHSLEEKLSRKTKNNKYTCLADITDLVGARIILASNSDVDKIKEAIERSHKFKVTEATDKRIQTNSREFGYQSFHILVEREVCGQKFQHEIQLRTVLQNAWSEIEHRYGYKSDRRNPTADRYFSQISALLEVADEKFESIINYQADDSAGQFNGSPLSNNELITSSSLIDYLHSPNRPRLQVPDSICTSENFRTIASLALHEESPETIQFMALISEANIRTIAQLESIISYGFNVCIKFLNTITPGMKPKIMREMDFLWISVFLNLCKHSEAHGLKQLFDSYGYFSKENRPEFANLLAKAAKERD